MINDIDMDSIWNSVGNSVWDSVRDSVDDSITDLQKTFYYPLRTLPGSEKL